MPFTASDIAKREPPSIASRGRAYITHVDLKEMVVNPGHIQTWVYGGRDYKVSIAKKSENYYEDDCTCPYGATCKHTIALAYVIEQNPHLKQILEGHPAAVEGGTQAGLNWLTTLQASLSSSDSRATSPTPQQSHHGIAYVLTINSKNKDFFERGFHEYSDDHAPTQLLSIEAYKYRHLKTRDEVVLNRTAIDASNALVQRPQYLHRQFDYQLLHLLKTARPSWGFLISKATTIPTYQLDTVLPLLAQADYVFWEADKRYPLKISADPAHFVLQGQLDKEQGIHWQQQLTHPQWDLSQTQINQVFDYPIPLVLTTDYQLLILDQIISSPHLRNLLQASTISAKDLQKTKTRALLLDLNQCLPLQLPKQWQEQAIPLEPTPVITLDWDQAPWQLDLKFHYQNKSVDPFDSQNSLFTLEPNNKRVPFGKRNPQFEEKILTQLSQKLNLTNIDSFPIVLMQPASEVLGIIANLAPTWEVWIKDDAKPISRQAATLSTQTKSEMDWLDVEGELTFSDSELKLAQILGEALSDLPMIEVNGQKRLLSIEQHDMLKNLQRLYDHSHQKIRLHRTHIGLMDHLNGVLDEKVLPKHWQQSLHQLRNFSGIKKTKLPKKLQATLRDYQHHGHNWLQFLNQCSFGGILADDMGLGKTVQALSLLTQVYETNAKQKISLIVAPTSVVYNWEDEIRKFTPHLKTHLFVGKDRILPKLHQADIILTSYALLWRDHKTLQKLTYHYLILDEAQYIKNHTSKTFQAASSLRSQHRLSLTGTPLENNLTELWTQFRFVNPGMFGSLEQFKQQFAHPIEKADDTQAKAHLKAMIKPFLLRRTKEVVLKELPPKVEQTQWCEMQPKQTQLYDAIKTYYQARVFELIEDRGIAQSQIQILEALLRLRQVCCHPQLLKLDQRQNKFRLPKALQNVTQSTKLDEFLDVVKTAVRQDHKVLVFSQFTSMLDILKQHLYIHRIPLLMLTGQTKISDRRSMIRSFQETADFQVFLLSLKAGGTGLNLTAADYVIHYDPWWNPAVEAQATDRAHRIGQQKTVHTYKLLVKNTIEEKIQQLQDKKKGLIDDLITASAKSKRLTKEDLQFLFA